jgi:LysR family glycine cleavage system transcriptional activator
VTHGAVSKQIQVLEQWLGQTLFVRSGQRMVPTLHGLAFAREISEAFDRIADATQRYGTVSATSVLHINAPTTFSMRWLIPRLPLFYAQSSDTEIRVSTSSALTESLRGPFDLAIRRGPRPWDQFDAVPFLDEWNTLMASPALLDRQPFQALSDLTRHVMLSSETRPRDWEDWLDAAGWVGPLPARRYRYDHFFVASQAAIDGLGLMVGPMPVLTRDVAAGRLVMPFPNIRVTRLSYFVLTPFDVDKTAAMRSFIEWLLEAGKD